MQKDVVDYYKILNCSRHATTEEIKKCYQQLILSLHPDKGEGSNEEMFHLVHKAWSVLRDRPSRRQYDAILNLHEINEPLIYTTISLSIMPYDADRCAYKYDCRCGGTYILNYKDSFAPKIIVGCDECSFSLQVLR